MHSDPDDLHKRYKKFLPWERRTRDAIDVKRAYIEMAGDAATGLLLSQIVYYYLPASDGSSKLRIEQDGHLWIAKRRKDWWAECRLRPKQADRAIAKLKGLGLVETATYQFHSIPTQHIRLNMAVFLDLLGGTFDAELGTTASPNEDTSSRNGNPTSPNGEIDFPDPGSPPYIDNSSKRTSKSTQETTAETAPSTASGYFFSGDGSSSAASDKRTANSFPEEESSDDPDYSEAFAVLATIDGFERHLPSERRLKRYFATKKVPRAAVVAAALAMQAKLRYIPSERKWLYDSPNGPRRYADLYARLSQWARAEQSGPPRRGREVSESPPDLTMAQIEAMSDEELNALETPFDSHKSNRLAIQVAAIQQDRQRAAAST